MDKISSLVAEALGHARVVRKSLDGRVIPLLEPRHRSFADEISRRISARAIVSEAFVRDIEAFIAVLEELVGDETSYAWRGHEHDPDCGYHVPVRSERGAVIVALRDALVKLAAAVEAAIDAAEAFTIANALFDPS